MERPRFKTYFDPQTLKPRPISSWIEAANTNDHEIEEDESEYDSTILTTGMTQEGGRLLHRILGSKAFPYPKPLSLVRSLIRSATRGNDLVLDSFAGSGTTGHAVLDLNSEDRSHRRFILVELDADICCQITTERLRRAIEGYIVDVPKKGRAEIDGLGGAFRYCTLAEPLFDEGGNIGGRVSFPDLASHVFFTETGAPIPKRANGRNALLGIHCGKAVYLLFNGVLGDKRPNGGNVLTREVLRALPAHEGPRVIYGEGCRMGSTRLKREGIVFKQIPYGIKVS